MQDVRCNWIFSQTEPGSVGSTKPVTLIAKSSYSNSPLETPPRNLEATPLLYFSIAKLTSIPQQVIELTKKLREKKIEKNKTHAIKWNKW